MMCVTPLAGEDGILHLFKYIKDEKKEDTRRLASGTSQKNIYIIV